MVPPPSLVRRSFLSAALLAFAAPALHAGVLVQQQMTPPKPGNLFVEPVSLVTGIPGHCDAGAPISAKNTVSQTFTPGTDMLLGAIILSYSTTAASPADAFRIRILEVPEGPDATEYAEGPNLVSDFSFGLESTNKEILQLKFAFDGTDQIKLLKDKTYAVELSGTTASLVLYRRATDTYTRGNFYLNRVAYNSPKTRDLAMGVIKAGGADGADWIAGPTPVTIPESFGIQILDSDAKDNEGKDLVADIGFKVFRKGLYWNQVEKTQGVYDFELPGYDAIIHGLISRGLSPYLCLFGGNKLYTATERAVTTDEGRQAYAKFAAEVARHYPEVKRFEIWNEPDHQAFWDTPPSPKHYADLVAVAAPAIRAERPDAKIGGPATAGPVSFDWLQEAFREGLLEHLDYIAIHPYPINGGLTPPEASMAEYLQVRALIDEHAPAGKEIAIVAGEWGYHSDETPTGLTFEKQSQYASRMALIHLSFNMPFHIWFTLKDGTWSLKGVDNFGLLRFDGKEQKPSLLAFKTLMSVLKGYSFEKRLPVADASAHMLQFTLPNGKKAVAFWKLGDTAPVQIPLPKGRGTLHALLGESAPSRWGADGLTVDAGESPQYLVVE